MESSENLNISKEEDPGVLERVYDISTDYVKDVVNDGLDLIAPEDNEETIKKTIAYSTYLPSLYSQYSVFTPYPGTPIFNEFKSIIN